VPHLLTGEAVPAVPFAFDALLGAVTLVLVLACLVCYGLREAWGHTIGYGLRWVADEIENVSVSLGWFGSAHPFGFLARALRKTDHVVAHALAVAALNTENAAVTMWHMTATVFWWSVHETKSLAVDTFHALEHTVTVIVPDAAKWARREAVSFAHSLVHQEAAARRAADDELHHLAHVAGADARTAGREAEHALGWSEAEVGYLDREIGSLKARLREIERTLSPAAIVALIGATIFNDFGLGWLRCSQVGRLGRAVCGLPTSLFSDLLGLLGDYFVVTSICRVLPLLEDAYVEVGTPLVEAVTDASRAICATPDLWPPDPSTPGLYLPAVLFDGSVYLPDIQASRAA
jgi:hypothetical protein